MRWVEEQVVLIRIKLTAGEYLLGQAETDNLQPSGMSCHHFPQYLE